MKSVPIFTMLLQIRRDNVLRAYRKRNRGNVRCNRGPFLLIILPFVVTRYLVQLY